MNPNDAGLLSSADTWIFWVQALAWVIAFSEITLGLYTLVTNPRQQLNHNLALLLLLFGFNSVGVAQLVSAEQVWQTRLPTVLLAITTTGVQPLLIIASLLIAHPEWLSAAGVRSMSSAGFAVPQPPTLTAGRKKSKLPVWRIILVLLYLLALLPGVLVAYDFWGSGAAGGVDTAIYYTGMEPDAYTGGFAGISAFTQGLIAAPLRIMYFALLNTILVGLLIYFVRFDRSLARRERRLAGMQLIVVLVVLILQAVGGRPEVVALGPSALSALPGLLSGVLLTAVYTYTAYQQILAEHTLQRGSLAYRIAALVLVVSVPLMIAQVLYTSNRAGELIESGSSAVLQQQNQALSAQVELWLDLNTRALADLALRDEIRSMDAQRQLPVLQAMLVTYPYMNLVATTDTAGLNVVRSDGLAAADNSARLWFRKIMEGESLSSQILLGATPRPVLVVAKPIYDDANLIVGVVMFEANLDAISLQFQTVRIGQTGTAFLVNENDQLIAHPDPAFTAWLRDYSDYVPVQALRSGQTGFVPFLDSEGRVSRAYVSRLQNGWGVVVEQSEDELLSPLRQAQNQSMLILVVGLALLGLVVVFTVRQGLLPVRVLTEAVAAIAAGDLKRQVPVDMGDSADAPGGLQRSDEMGFLAQAFNRMTAELSELIGGLEQRVDERTQDLTRRSVQLEAAAQVARNAAGIRDVGLLLTQTTQLIAATFQYYHSGIFIIDDAREFAVLQAANSSGGQRMLARGHKLKVGQVGIVGYVAANGRPRIASDVGEDAVFFNNPDLPETRSEMALPLIVNERVIGVLDVQSTESLAFRQEDIEVLQILADQLALAIENTRLLEETRRTLDELRGLYGERTRQDWQDRLRRGAIVYQYTRLGVTALEKVDEIRPAARNEATTLQLPILLRGQQLGEITLQRDPDQPAWTEEEMHVAGEAISQVAAALENARLLEEAQARSTQLHLLQEVTAVAASHTNLLELLDNVSQKLRAGLDLLHCGVILIDPAGDTGTLVVNASADPFHSGTKMVGTKLPLNLYDRTRFDDVIAQAGTSPFVAAARDRKTSVNYDPQNTLPAGTLQNFARQRESGTMLVTPLVSRNQVIGFLMMDYARAGAGSAGAARLFTDEELQLLDQISLQISSAMDVARSFEQTTQRAEREQRMGEITSHIRETLDIESILRTTAEEIRLLLDVPEVTIQLVNPEHDG